MEDKETFNEWCERIEKDGRCVLSSCPGANYAAYLKDKGRIEEYEKVCKALCGPTGEPGSIGEFYVDNK